MKPTSKPSMKPTASDYIAAILGGLILAYMAASAI